jgi:hypothetical protein
MSKGALRRDPLDPLALRGCESRSARSSGFCRLLTSRSPAKVAEREGFEPSEEFPPHMISSHADSARLSHLSLGGASGFILSNPRFHCGRSIIQTLPVVSAYS